MLVSEYACFSFKFITSEFLIHWIAVSSPFLPWRGRHEFWHEALSVTSSVSPVGQTMWPAKGSGVQVTEACGNRGAVRLAKFSIGSSSRKTNKNFREKFLPYKVQANVNVYCKEKRYANEILRAAGGWVSIPWWRIAPKCSALFIVTRLAMWTKYWATSEENGVLV